MLVKQLTNSIFTSNTYVISNNKYNWVWMIDIGDIEGVLNSLTKDTIVKGVFITHPHFDHIYGINKLIDSFPDCVVYTSAEGKKGLYSDKLNLSHYHGDPIIFLGSNIQILMEKDVIQLFENAFLETIETPGHDWGCLSYKIGNYLFTGDSYIPGVPVVTKLKGGNREANLNSLKKIKSLISNNTIVCPGHGPMTNHDS